MSEQLDRYYETLADNIVDGMSDPMGIKCTQCKTVFDGDFAYESSLDRSHAFCSENCVLEFEEYNWDDN